MSYSQPPNNYCQSARMLRLLWRAYICARIIHLQSSLEELPFPEKTTYNLKQHMVLRLIRLDNSFNHKDVFRSVRCWVDTTCEGSIHNSAWNYTTWFLRTGNPLSVSWPLWVVISIEALGVWSKADALFKVSRIVSRELNKACLLLVAFLHFESGESALTRLDVSSPVPRNTIQMVSGSPLR